MFADILRIALGADIAFFNGGTIRSDQVGGGRWQQHDASQCEGVAPAGSAVWRAAQGATCSPPCGSCVPHSTCQPTCPALPPPPAPAPPKVHGAGQLTMRDFVAMLPFTDELVLLELSGADVLVALETGVGSWPALEGRFLQVRRGQRAPAAAGRAAAQRQRRAGVGAGRQKSAAHPCAATNPSPLAGLGPHLCL